LFQAACTLGAFQWVCNSIASIVVRAAPRLLKSVPLDGEQRPFGRGGANRVAAQVRPTYL